MILFRLADWLDDWPEKFSSDLDEIFQKDSIRGDTLKFQIWVENICYEWSQIRHFIVEFRVLKLTISAD